MEHNPLVCGCKYLGCDMWSCGHVDNQPDDEQERTEEDKCEDQDSFSADHIG